MSQSRRLLRDTILGAYTNAFMMTGAYPLLLRHRSTPWRATLGEWGAGYGMSLLRPLSLVGSRLTPAGSFDTAPVIVAHGLFMNRACFLPMAARLAKQGIGPVYGFQYWTLGRVTSAADELAACVEDVKKRHGASRVHFVGHSLGGLVGRYYATVLGGAENLLTLSTLGTPHSGLRIKDVKIPLGRFKADVAPKSEVMSALADAGMPRASRVLVVRARNDELVPPRAGAWPGVPDHFHDGLGHVGLLASRAVASQVADHIRQSDS